VAQKNSTGTRKSVCAGSNSHSAQVHPWELTLLQSPGSRQDQGAFLGPIFTTTLCLKKKKQKNKKTNKKPKNPNLGTA